MGSTFIKEFTIYNYFHAFISNLSDGRTEETLCEKETSNLSEGRPEETLCEKASM